MKRSQTVRPSKRPVLIGKTKTDTTNKKKYATQMFAIQIPTVVREISVIFNQTFQ